MSNTEALDFETMSDRQISQWIDENIVNDASKSFLNRDVLDGISSTLLRLHFKSDEAIAEELPVLANLGTEEAPQLASTKLPRPEWQILLSKEQILEIWHSPEVGERKGKFNDVAFRLLHEQYPFLIKQWNYDNPYQFSQDVANRIVRDLDDLDLRPLISYDEAEDIRKFGDGDGEIVNIKTADQVIDVEILVHEVKTNKATGKTHDLFYGWAPAFKKGRTTYPVAVLFADNLDFVNIKPLSKLKGVGKTAEDAFNVDTVIRWLDKFHKSGDGLLEFKQKAPRKGSKAYEDAHKEA